MSLTGNFDKLTQRKEDTGEFYATDSTVRYLTFVQLDNSQVAFKYSLLLKVSFTDEHDTITLDYPSDKVTLRGKNINNIFVGIENETIRKITCIEERYMSIDTYNNAVFEINVKAL